MSSEYLEDVEYENKSVFLTMRASGFAQLTIMEEDEHNDANDIIASFHLMPNKDGLENAKKISDALNSWSEHIKLVGLVED